MKLDVSQSEMAAIIDAVRQEDYLNYSARARRVYGYIRVSSPESARSGLSLEDQSDAIERTIQAVLLQNPDLERGEVYVDRGVSAIKYELIRRPEGRKLLAAIEPGDHLVVKRLDRAFRNLLDQCKMVALWEKKGITIHCIDLGLDTSTPAGRLVAHVLGALAQYEGELIRERNQARSDQKRKRMEKIGVDKLPNGGVSGKRPVLGYRKKGPPRKAYLVPDAEQRAWMGWIRRLKDAGLSFKEVTDNCNQRLLNLGRESDSPTFNGDSAERFKIGFTKSSVKRWYYRAVELGIEPNTNPPR
jgi:DNA invertase Pin-like site-specific DNA recombinase